MLLSDSFLTCIGVVFFNLSFTHLTFYVLFYLIMQMETEVFKLLMELLLDSAISCSIILQINGEQNGFCPCKPVCCGVSKMTEGNWLLWNMGMYLKLVTTIKNRIGKVNHLQGLTMKTWFSFKGDYWQQLWIINYKMCYFAIFKSNSWSHWSQWKKLPLP